MKVRLIGNPAECSEMVTVLEGSLDLELVAVSEPYPCRGDRALVRVYADVRLVDLAEVRQHRKAQRGGEPDA